MRRFRSLLMMVLIACLTLPAVSLATTAEDLFEDGNRLFRDNLYWAALLRYGQAAEAGLNTPLLHYNTGVAHYRAGQYSRARKAFLESSRYSGLEVLSQYNLGLTAYASGNIDEALRWFRKSRDQEQSRDISKLSEKAIARMHVEAVEEDPIAARAEVRREEQQREFKKLDLYAFVGAGSDSNIFRAPSESYVDLADPNLPVVDPVVQSGVFMPINMSAVYNIKSYENESFFGAYRVAGRYYQDKNLSNANEYKHELSFGNEYFKRGENSERKVFSAFTIAQADKVYYDRDNGAGQVVNGVDISDRMNYRRYGPEIWFRQSFEKLSFGARGVAQLWNYEDTGEVPAYDHQFLLAGLNAQYKFAPTTLLRLTGEYYQRHFNDRPSYELDGTQPIGNQPVEYDYLELGLTLRQRVTRAMWFGMDYVRTQRNDRYVGYNNYVRNDYGLNYHLGIGQKFDFEMSGIYRIYDYGDAFAFHTAAGGRKTMERVFANLVASYQVTDHLSLSAEYRYDDVASNDTRLAYNRSQYFLGILWER